MDRGRNVESARKGTEMRVHLMDDFYLMMLVTKKRLKCMRPLYYTSWGQIHWGKSVTFYGRGSFHQDKHDSIHRGITYCEL